MEKKWSDTECSRCGRVVVLEYATHRQVIHGAAIDPDGVVVCITCLSRAERVAWKLGEEVEI